METPPSPFMKSLFIFFCPFFKRKKEMILKGVWRVLRGVLRVFEKKYIWLPYVIKCKCNVYTRISSIFQSLISRTSSISSISKQSFWEKGKERRLCVKKKMAKWLKKCSGKEGEKIAGNEGKSKLSGRAATESGYMGDYF